MKTDYIHIVDNVFSEKIIEDLYTSCKKHFTYNLNSNNEIEITRCIVDCHGLALSPSSYFPYTERHWNIFCLKIKKYVLQYCNVVGIDESIIVPHSCWAERSTIKNFSKGLNFYRDDFQLTTDDWLKKHLIRVIYYLRNEDDFFGTDIKIGNDIKDIPGKPNSIVIFDGGTNRSSNKYPINSDSSYKIIFDWYINKPYKVPDWVLP